MELEELAAMLKALERKNKILEKKLRVIEDVEAIQRLQKIYGYYLEHWMSQEIVDLFSDAPDISLELSVSGVFVGKESVRRYFFNTKPTPEFLHQMMQIGGVIDVAPNGKTAKGRWYGWGLMALPRGEGVWQGFNNGIYECEYVKENGKWKFKKIHWNRIFLSPYHEGWVAPARQAKGALDALSQMLRAKPDLPTTVHQPYPSGYVVPFHYKHPVTGK
jgi:hypothetical protein